MAMQLFSFGHPCEHQLRRTCIGGSSCPLHGYPDTWCCSFVKGKINFKRDKPCEGPRCRWGFTHPTQAQFDAVTQVIADGKAIATKLDESGADDMLQFQIDSQHVVDTVQCALHVMKHPPSSCGKKIGQLLAYAAVKAQEPKVFTQLLKTMKKPIDSYLLGAYDFLAHMRPAGGSAASAPPKKGGGGGSKSKDDVIDDLRSDIVDVMGAALSQNGQLVVREDQQQLQFVFINALKTFPKNKKKQEMLEVALSKYKFPPPGAVPPAPPCVIDTPELPPAAPAAPAKVDKRVDPVKAVAPVDDLPAATRATASTTTPPPPAVAAAAQKRESPGVSLPQQPQVQPVRRIVGMSRVPNPLPQKPRLYTPMQPVDVNIPTETLLLGGLLGLHSKQPSLLGPASSLMAPSLSEGNSPLRALGEGTAPTSTAAPLSASEGSGSLATFSIFGAEPIVGAATTFPSADRSLLEGVMHAWGQ